MAVEYQLLGGDAKGFEALGNREVEHPSQMDTDEPDLTRQQSLDVDALPPGLAAQLVYGARACGATDRGPARAPPTWSRSAS